MSRQEIGFTERHVEKLAMGVGGLLMFAAAGLVVLGRAQSVESAGIIPAQVERINAELAGDKPTVSGREFPIHPESLRAAPARTPVVVARATPGAPTAATVWDRPKANEDRTPPPPPTPKYRPPAPTAPKSLEAVPARGFAPVAKAAGPKSEFLGVQLRLDLDAKAVYRQWWPMHQFVRDRAVAHARANLIAPKDINFAAAEADFAFRWRLIVFGVEIEQQAYDPVRGWEQDAGGGDLWRRVEKPWGKVGEQGWLKMMADCGNDDELPPFPARRDNPALQAKFEDTRGKLVTAYSAVRSDCQWPTPPGPAGVETFNRHGERNPGPVRSWITPPKPPAPALVPAPGPGGGLVRASAGKPGVRDDEGLLPPQPERAAPAPAPVKTEDAELTFESAVRMRLGDGGDVRALSAFVIDDSLQPGRTYRFRARVLVRNPAFDWADSAPADVENRFFLATDWTPPCAPVTMPENIRFYLLSGEKGGGADAPIHRPMIQIFRWSEGAWYGTKLLRPAPGEMIRPTKKEELVAPHGGFAKVPFDQKSRADFDRALALFDTGCLLLDVREEAVVLERQPNRASGLFQPTTGNRTRITYLDGNGVVQSRIAAYDAADLRKWDAK